MTWQPPPGAASGAANTAQPAQQQPTKEREMDYYELLQVNRDAHPTIIRYSYRFLAAMYHPDNGETGDATKFRTISEAWRTLSDEGKRAAYDLSLGMLDQRKADQNAGHGQGQTPTQQAAKRESLPNNPKQI